MGDLNISQVRGNEETSPLLPKEVSAQQRWWQCCRRRVSEKRVVRLGVAGSFPTNAVVNTKYNVLTFVPVVLYNQFKHFFNLFFLIITVSQFYPPLQVGFLFTYVAPLSFVLIVTMIKESYDDLVRWGRDKEVNGQMYTKLTPTGQIKIPAESVQVGDLIMLKADERVPADMILLRSSEESGTVFLRTDQLDGETDWKLRKAVSFTQMLHNPETALPQIHAQITAEAPHRNIYSFQGVFEVEREQGVAAAEPLSLDHTMWGSTILASTWAYGMVIYTGKESRSVMNSSTPSSKFGVSDLELNRLAKFLFILMMGVSAAIVVMAGINKYFFILAFRYLLLLSYIIPISLRVNLDLAKIYYCYMINRDKTIQGTVARNSNIPEELGRVEVLLTDKTGTLTQNVMVFKKCSFEFTMIERDDVEHMSYMKTNLDSNCVKYDSPMMNIVPRKKRENEGVIRDLVAALALCHNVTPIWDQTGVHYQASSPDEVALVKFAETLDYKLRERRQEYIMLENPKGGVEQYIILQIFPFASATKRMGIILKHQKSGKVIFYLKGAEDVMATKVLERTRHRILEDCETLAREGLRTLVITQRELQPEEYSAWKAAYDAVQLSMEDRDAKVRAHIDSLEHDMEYLAVTGVEDKLQENVPQTIENMQNAGISVWMLTGDKVETAECIGISTRLKLRDKTYFEFKNMSDHVEISKRLKTLEPKHIPVFDGHSLAVILQHVEQEFVETASKAVSVICCRVSPTQKATIAEAIKKHAQKRVCSIGDGGNDVGMILAAHVGVGIEGKEGKQASLAADFSIPDFKCLNSLLLWHGRLSYKRTAKLSNFIFHRGLLISIVQILFSCLFYFSAIPIYNGFLMLGYTTVYTTLPVFSIVLDEDADMTSVMKFPNLYKTLQKGRALGFTMFCLWLWRGVYQGSVIILLAIVLFPDNNFINIVAITFTALIATELLNVMSEIERFHWAMGVSEVVTLIIYICSIFLMKSYFDIAYIVSLEFLWRVAVITASSWCPLHIGRIIKDKFYPSDHQKVMGGSR